MSNTETEETLADTQEENITRLCEAIAEVTMSDGLRDGIGYMYLAFEYIDESGVPDGYKNKVALVRAAYNSFLDERAALMDALNLHLKATA